jgi:hypothetical protein
MRCVMALDRGTAACPLRATLHTDKMAMLTRSSVVASRPALAGEQ